MISKGLRWLELFSNFDTDNTQLLELHNSYYAKCFAKPLWCAVMPFPKTQYLVAFKFSFSLQLRCISHSSISSHYSRFMQTHKAAKIAWVELRCLSVCPIMCQSGKYENTLPKIWINPNFTLCFGGLITSYSFLTGLRQCNSCLVRTMRGYANNVVDIWAWIMHFIIRSGTRTLLGNIVCIIMTDGICQQQSQSSSTAVHSLT